MACASSDCRPTRRSRASHYPQRCMGQPGDCATGPPVRWTAMLVRVATFWLAYGSAAKSTMHGFAAIAGRQITEPPGAGFLGEHVRAPTGPFVVMVNSTTARNDVRTPRMVVTMSAEQVKDFRRGGSVAVKLTNELCATLSAGIDGGYAYGIPNLLADRLSRGDRATLADAQGDEGPKASA